MDDLVKRLSGIADVLTDLFPEFSKDINAAADRIEQLEAALRFAAEVISSIDSFDSDHPEEALEWIMQESAALGEKKDGTAQ